MLRLFREPSTEPRRSSRSCLSSVQAHRDLSFDRPDTFFRPRTQEAQPFNPAASSSTQQPPLPDLAVYGELDPYYPPPPLIRQPVRPLAFPSLGWRPDVPSFHRRSSTITSTPPLSLISPTSIPLKPPSTPSSSPQLFAKTCSVAQQPSRRSRPFPFLDCQTSFTSTIH